MNSKSARKIGLIGGLGPRAGIFYYEQRVQRSYCGRADFGADAQPRQVKKLLPPFLETMWQVSATIWVLLQTNCTMRERMSLLSRRFAPHLAIKEVFEIARVPVVNVLHVAAAALRSAGISRAAVFGNRAVMQSSILGMLQENRVMKLGADLLEGILETYTAIALDGKRGSPQEVQ
jgi:hypothetical protein